MCSEVKVMLRELRVVVTSSLSECAPANATGILRTVHMSVAPEI